MKRIKIAIATVMLCIFMVVSTDAADILAHVQAPPHLVRIEASGESWDNSCQLNLISGHRIISIKDRNYNCSLYGPIKLTVTGESDRHKPIIIIEGARGGDGDHTGPIIQIFRIIDNKFKKIGEEELFDAVYKSNKGLLKEISGKKLFSFCDVCDGWDAAEKGDNIFVPAIIRLYDNSIKTKANINKAMQMQLMKEFAAQKKIRMEELSNAGRDYESYVTGLEKSFKHFIGVQ